MKRVMFGGLSVLLVIAATPPAFAAGKVNGSNIEVLSRGLQTFSSSLTGQWNSLGEVPSPTLQSENPGSLKQTIPAPTSGLQTPKTLHLTQQNPPSEVPSPTLLLFERQQALIAQMETMIAQMKVMMAQMKTMASKLS